MSMRHPTGYPPRLNGRGSRPLTIGRIRISKIKVFFGLYTIVLLVPLLVAVFGQDWLRQSLAGPWWVGPFALFGLLATVAPIIYLAIIRRLENRLLHDQRRYHRTLIMASSGMTRIKEINRLCGLIVHMVNHAVGLTNTSIFLCVPKEHRYVLQAVRYRSLFPGQLAVDDADPLVTLLQERKDLLMLDELHQEMQKLGKERGQRAAWVYAWMRKLEARLVVPSFSNERLLAFLVLGAKCSAEPYSTDDVAIFSGLANQAALAIENALFFEELRTSEAHMIQSEKLASLGQLASGMAHEIHNPLTIISGEAQLYLERFKGKDGKVDELLKSIIEECKRAADITRRILRFAKPAPPEVTAVDLKSTVEETLSLAAYQVRMEHIERKVEMPEGLPKVRSNQNQLQEVVLNLILNACQAMGEQGGSLALSSSANGAYIILKVADTGPGIPSGKLMKIFDPFFTTKQSGTGLGLFVSQRIVQSHGGTIEVESTEGQGTCFTIRLPIWQEPVPALSGMGS